MSTTHDAFMSLIEPAPPPSRQAYPGRAAVPLRSSERRVPLPRLTDHIRCNLSRRIRVEELARIAGLSAQQVSRAFRREHARTPYAFVLEIRIAHAKSLLAAGAVIADVAADAGFADQSHFTRHFRRLVGMTPREYLQARC